MAIVPSSLRVAMRANAPRMLGAAAFSTSVSSAMASPASERPSKMKAFKIYRWVGTSGSRKKNVNANQHLGPRKPSAKAAHENLQHRLEPDRTYGS
jgi:hypothetical protein